MGATARQMMEKIQRAFQPVALEVIDESAQHHGHAGWKEGGETHFFVRVVSDHFRGMNRVARQQAVYRVLSDEVAGRVHALRMETKTPEETRLATRLAKPE